MKNLYQPTKLLTLDQFQKMEKAFVDSWSIETTYPDLIYQWNEENKALGQCAPTALVVCDLLGGRLIYDKENFHFWNELPDGTQQDFSRSQFTDKRVFSAYKYKTKNDLLFDESGQRTNILKRYGLLKRRFQKAMKDLE